MLMHQSHNYLHSPHLNSTETRTILYWLGIESYPVYVNLPITEAQKQDPDQLLAAFEKYFKPERNIFQSWYALGSIYSGPFLP